MKFIWCLVLGLCVSSAEAFAAGKSAGADKEYTWRLRDGGQSQGRPAHLDGLPDAQELEQLLAREASEDPEVLYRLGLAYENDELWEPDYEKALSYFQRSEKLGYPWAKSQLGYYFETGLAGPQDYEKAVSLYQQGADFGDSWSGLRLGYLYLEGRGIRQHDGQALFWIQWASRGGVAEATSALGWLHETGRGTKVDLREAARLYGQAGNAGHPSGWVNLGLLYETGALGEQDHQKAAELYRKASDAGFARGKHNLGTMYYWGLGVEEDRKLAVSLFREAIELGYPYAHIALGLAHEQGGGLERDYAQAAKHYRLAIDANGYPRAKAYLAWLYQEGRGVEHDVSKSRELYEEAAAEGQLFALTELGYVLVTGEGGQERDVHRGRRLLEQAAERDYPAAILTLANMYETGDGVAKDQVEALRLYRIGAGIGDTDALIALGDIHFGGEQVEQDFDKAFELYSRALDQGNDEALLSLGYLFATAEWPRHDFGKAMELFRKADETGVENAPTFLGIAYFHGDWVGKDDRLARAYFKRAVEDGYHLSAQYLGFMAEEGLGGPKEKDAAVRYYGLAAEGDEYFAVQRLMAAYREDGWVGPDESKLLHWTVRAGELGDAAAAYEAAERLYLDPKQQDLEKAAELYRVASDDGNLDAAVKWARMQILGEVDEADIFAGIGLLEALAEATPLSALGPLSQLINEAERGPGTPKHKAERELFLGLAYANGIIFPKDTGKAEEHLRRSLQLAPGDFPVARVALAVLLLGAAPDDPDSNSEIMDHLKFAANRGHMNAQLMLAEVFATGVLQQKYLDEPNTETGLMWLRLAARKSEIAQLVLATALSEEGNRPEDAAGGRRMLEDLAAFGNADAAYWLGYIYSDQEVGDVYDPDHALVLFEKSARFGNIDAVNAIGLLHQNALITNSSDKKAYEFLVRAAEAGHADATASVGWHLKNGVGVERNVLAAEDWFLRSREMGSEWADLNLAMLYVEEDRSFDTSKTAQAIPVLQMLADQGNSYAYMTLGHAFVHGIGVSKDPEKGLDLFVRAVDEHPGAARVAIGNYHALGKGGVVDYDIAFEYYSVAAGLGSAIALNNLGWMYEHGLSVEQDFTRAAEFYEDAAEKGFGDALASLGILYRDGSGFERDHGKALQLFEEARALGLSGGTANVGWMKLHGWGVPTNKEEGLSLIRESAAQGDHDGAYYLAVLLEDGKELKRDRGRAIDLYKIAADKGNLRAKEALKRLGEAEELPFVE